MPSGRFQLVLLAGKLDLLLRETVPRVQPCYPVPEKAGSGFSLNIFHQLEQSKWKQVSPAYYKGMDYLYLTYYFLRKDLDIMANGNAKKDFGDFEFVQFKLNADEGKEFNQWLEEHAKHYDAYYRDMLIDEYKISASFDARGDCFIVSLTGKGEKNPNSGKTLVSRSQDEREAFMLGYYKHVVLFKKRAWKSRAEDTNWG